jgi:hypothetical protein
MRTPSNTLWTPHGEVRPEFAQSRIIAPAEGWEAGPAKGNVVIHAPFQRDYDAEVRQASTWSNYVRERERTLKRELRKLLAPIFGAAAGNWTFTNATRTNLLNGTHDVDSDSWKMALFLSTSNIGAGSTTYAGVTNEHANANGYTTGGIAITLTLSGTTTVTIDIQTDPVWTASGGSLVARFAVIYEVGGQVLCYCLLDSAPADVTATDGNTLTVAANASGVFTVA